MNRRESIRRAMLLAIGTSMAGHTTQAHANPAMLTVDLNQWSTVVFKLKGKTVYVPVAEIFAALQEGE